MNGFQMKKLDEDIVAIQKEITETDPDKLNDMGVAYSEEDKMKKAAACFALSAAQGNARGQCNLALCYKTGGGVNKDVREEVKLYKQAAAQGDEVAQNNLAVCLWKTQGEERNRPEALRLFKNVAKKGNAWAQATLGFVYLEGDKQAKIKRSEKLAFFWLQKALCQPKKNSFDLTPERRAVILKEINNLLRESQMTVLPSGRVEITFLLGKKIKLPVRKLPLRTNAGLGLKAKPDDKTP